MFYKAQTEMQKEVPKSRTMMREEGHKSIIITDTTVYHAKNRDVVMLVKFECYSDGKYWCGRGIGVDIFTQGKSLDDLMANIREAVELHFEEELTKGESIRILSISETEVGTVARASGC